MQHPLKSGERPKMRARPYQLANERLLGAESMPLAGEHGELCSLKRDFFAGGLTGHDARSVIVCRKNQW